VSDERPSGPPRALCLALAIGFAVITLSYVRTAFVDGGAFPWVAIVVFGTNSVVWLWQWRRVRLRSH